MDGNIADLYGSKVNMLSFKDYCGKKVGIVMTSRKKWILIFSGILIIACIWITFAYKNSAQADTVRFQDGTIYHGTTEKGKLRSGVMHFNNGDTYTGSFKDGHFDGWGVYKSHEGWSFEGEFRHGTAEGNGQLKKKGKVIQSGKYSNGVYIK